MFLNAVVLVLQEILEAALLVSVMLVFTQLFHQHWHSKQSLKYNWVYYSVVFGVIGAALYAYYTPQISEWFDYVGQEVVNASVHILSLIFLLILVFIVPSQRLDSRPDLRSKLNSLCMIVVVLFSIVREGSEIIHYIGGIASQPGNFSPVVFGSIIGAGIGASTGILLFYGLASLSGRAAFRAGLILLALIAGNMASQAALLLNQADWLPYTPMAWNSSNLIPETSIIGHLLYALIGYEATPSILQLACYVTGGLLICVSPLFREIWRTQTGSQSR